MIFFGLTRLPPTMFLLLSLLLVALASVLMWHLVESRFLKSSSHYRQVPMETPA
jgi:peptidoglycan/LPS O-acetylase OafA/YrhL